MVFVSLFVAWPGLHHCAAWSDVELHSRSFEYSITRSAWEDHQAEIEAFQRRNACWIVILQHTLVFFNSPVTDRNQTKSLMKCSETRRTQTRCCCCSPGQWLPRRRIVTKKMGMYVKYYYFLNWYKFWHMKFRFVYNQDGSRKIWNPPSRWISQSIQSSVSHYQWRTGVIYFLRR